MFPWLLLTPPGALLGALVLWWLVPSDLLRAALKEGGTVETATACLYGAAIAALCLRVRLGRRDRRTRTQITAAVAVLAFLLARELDLHIRWTGTSMLRVSYYLDGAFGAAQALSLAVVLAFVACVRVGVASLRGDLGARLRSRNDAAVCVAVFLGVMVLTKVLDRSVAVLVQDFQWTVASRWATLIQACEEMAELSLPVLVLITLLGPGRKLLGRQAPDGRARFDVAAPTALPPS